MGWLGKRLNTGGLLMTDLEFQRAQWKGWVGEVGQEGCESGSVYGTNRA